MRTVFLALLVLTIGLAGCGGSSGQSAKVNTASGVTPGLTSSVTTGVTPSVTTGAPAPTVPNVPPPTVQGQPTVTASGLRIIDIQVGTGAAAEPGDTVTITDTGWLEDGTVFDTASAQRLSLGQLSPDLQEGVPGMRVGGKRRLIVPPNFPGAANAGHMLTFDIELVSIP